MIQIDLAGGRLLLEENGTTRELSIGSPEAFNIISRIWLRSGWDAKYVYSFSWLGRPIIQLPEDLVRIQELIYAVKPDVLIETGVAHGGSLIFYAGIFKAMERGRVIGVDIEIRPHNREAIASHFLAPYITLVEGSSTASEVVAKVRSLIKPSETVMVVLDSNHTKAHVLAELEAYSHLVTQGSYIVAADGIMGDIVGAPRTQPDWKWNNPREAAREFVVHHPEFVITEPEAPFNEGLIKERITYWPGGIIKRVR
jgi:cephalosporin hydroxylase